MLLYALAFELELTSHLPDFPRLYFGVIVASSSSFRKRSKSEWAVADPPMMQLQFPAPARRTGIQHGPHFPESELTGQRKGGRYAAITRSAFTGLLWVARVS